MHSTYCSSNNNNNNNKSNNDDDDRVGADMRRMRTPTAAPATPSMVAIIAAVIWIIQAYYGYVPILVNAMTEEHRLQEYKKRYVFANLDTYLYII